MLEINDSALSLHTNSLVPNFKADLSPFEINLSPFDDRSNQMLSSFKEDLISESIKGFAEERASLSPKISSPTSDPLTGSDKTYNNVLAVESDPITGLSSKQTLALPTVTVKVTDNLAGESNQGQAANSGSITLTRSGTTATALTVNYSLAGTATRGVDYANLTGRVTFARGATTANVNVNVINDTAVEGNESVIFTIANGAGYSIGANKTGTITIVDNDSAPVPGTLQQLRQYGSKEKDLGMGIATDSLGNTYVTGFSKTTSGYGSVDSWVAKYNAAGNRVWYKPFSTPDIPPTNTGSGLFGGYFDDLAVNIAVDGANNIYLGMTSQFHGGNLNDPSNPYDDEYLPDSDAVMIKMNSAGNILWQNRYDSSIEDIAWDMAIDKQGNAYLGGYGSEGKGAFLIKYTTNGTRSWVQRLGDSATDQIREITTDKTGNIYVAGRTYGNGYDSWFGKYNTNGALLWTKNLVSSSAEDDPVGIATDNNGNVYIAGFSGVNNAPNRSWLIKANSNGNILWNRTVNNTNSLAYGYKDLAVDGAGNAYVSGLKASSFGLQGVAVKYNTSGNILTEMTVGGPNGTTLAENVHLDRNNKILLTGFTTTALANSNLGKEDAWFAIFTNG